MAESFAVNDKVVRRWFDAGPKFYLVTPGGHCRYTREDVEVPLKPDVTGTGT